MKHGEQYCRKHWNIILTSGNGWHVQLVRYRQQPQCEAVLFQIAPGCCDGGHAADHIAGAVMYLRLACITATSFS